MKKHFVKNEHGFPKGSVDKESNFNAGNTGAMGSIPGSEEIPWRKKGQPTPVLPGKSHGQRSLVGSSPRGHKESDKTE